MKQIQYVEKCEFIDMQVQIFWSLNTLNFKSIYAPNLHFSGMQKYITETEKGCIAGFYTCNYQQLHAEMRHENA